MKRLQHSPSLTSLAALTLAASLTVWGAGAHARDHHESIPYHSGDPGSGYTAPRWQGPPPEAGRHHPRRHFLFDAARDFEHAAKRMNHVVQQQVRRTPLAATTSRLERAAGVFRGNVASGGPGYRLLKGFGHLANDYRELRGEYEYYRGLHYNRQAHDAMRELQQAFDVLERRARSVKMKPGKHDRGWVSRY